MTFGLWLYLQGIRVKVAYEGHWFKVKVTATKSENFPFSQCKNTVDSDSGSIEDQSGEVCVQQEVVGYGGSNFVTAVFVTRPEIHAFAGGLS